MPDCLVIDDEISIATTICEYFELFNVSCEYATSFDAGLKAVEEICPLMILLDVGLDGQSGFALCKKLRETSDVPILFISARNTDDDILTGLGVGGDDYITKPFSMAVLLAKVKAMLKRNAASPSPPYSQNSPHSTHLPYSPNSPNSPYSQNSPSPPYSPHSPSPPHSQNLSKPTNTESHEITRFGDVKIDRDSDRVYRSGELIKLKPLEMKLLLYLYDNRGRRVTKDELLEKVWGDVFIGEGTLSVHIRHLREKLENDPKYPCYIKTMWGSGYMFEAQE